MNYQCEDGTFVHTLRAGIDADSDILINDDTSADIADMSTNYDVVIVTSGSIRTALERLPLTVTTAKRMSQLPKAAKYGNGYRWWSRPTVLGKAVWVTVIGGTPVKCTVWGIHIIDTISLKGLNVNEKTTAMFKDGKKFRNI